MARPTEPKPKSVLLQVRITEEQKALFESFAEMDRRPLSTWARLVLEETAESCREAINGELSEREKSNLPVLGEKNGYIQGSNRSDLIAMMNRIRALKHSERAALIVHQVKHSTTSCIPTDLESQSKVEHDDVAAL